MSMEVWEHSKSSGTHRLTLLALADYADDEGRAWPSIDKLMKKINVKTTRAVRYLLQGLKASGELVIEYGKGPHGTNVFWVKPTAGRKSSSGRKRSSGRKPSSAEEFGTEGRKAPSSGEEEFGIAGRKPSSSKQSIELSVEQSENGQGVRANAPADVSFDEFAETFKARREIAYGHTRADFIQLADLRRRLGIGTRDPIPDWTRAVQNYLASPQSKYTLADLSSRFDVFRQSALDRFKQPLTTFRHSAYRPHETPGSTSERRDSKGRRHYNPKAR